MKLSLLFLLIGSRTIGAFAPSATIRTDAIVIKMSPSAYTSDGVVVADRRAFGVQTFSTSIAGLVAMPSIASAVGYGSEYSPRFEDLRQIYVLGVTLDKLVEKVSNPETFEAALAGLVQFNKEPGFYPNYARNYVSKTVKNNAAGDPRVLAVAEACKLIGSCQELLEGRTGLESKAASDEAVKRVKKSQALIAEFLRNSGLEDERVAAFVTAHPN